MKFKIICYGLINSSQTINRFGNAWLIEVADRQFRLVGGNDQDLANAQGWASLFGHEIILSQSQKLGGMRILSRLKLPSASPPATLAT